MNKSLSHHVYNDRSFAEQYAQNITNNPWNAGYERPASLSLLPDNLNGLHILDAGCGPGITTKEFLEKQATVTAIDYSDAMVSLAQENTGGRAHIVQHDLNEPLSMFANESFDVIYSSLVIHYIDDLKALFAEFRRVLRKGGLLIFSTDHPDNPFVKAQLAAGIRQSSVPWDGYNIHMDVYHRSWSEIESALTNNGFSVNSQLSPHPLPFVKDMYPNVYETLSTVPHFICIRAVVL
ncbi:class I SAM-dependent methyltransferase [Chitinophaga horti]|uniref:Class I SAM-dependent methyltransferase n=1 Tax=Chitinophaga horti TaxID=2920382 RepID=A0ABY6IU96_9BACT|nr:class I SAM-dependent methyltransferase [Chitinophaga horti]UYQ90963.1 class I SAM-dependent methyltransferase [Chitinophaga horti]